MRVQIDPSSFRRTTWYEYAVRFLSGGLITVAAGIIAHRFGPGLGGLFLAFPAIFPASATLVEKHENRKKQERGEAPDERGRMAAAVDGAGAAMGSIGLMAFAGVVWLLAPRVAGWQALPAALVAWAAVAGAC